jgi:hypothetical protein
MLKIQVSWDATICELVHLLFPTWHIVAYQKILIYTIFTLLHDSNICNESHINFLFICLFMLFFSSS